MKKGVYKLVISIILTISFILISIPLWNKTTGEKISLFSVDYSHMPLSINIGKFSSLIIIDDERAISTISPTTISVKNNNGYVSDNYMYLLYDKNSTIDYKYVRVSVDDKIYNLGEVEKEEDEANIYFKLNDLKIEEYKSVNYSVRIWINNSVEDISATSSLTTNFIIK